MVDGSELGINILPDELLLSIFELLPVESLIECEQVSQRWRTIARDPCIWREIVIIYDRHNREQFSTNLRLLETHCDVIQHIEMHNILCDTDILMPHVVESCKNITCIGLHSCELMDFTDETLTGFWPKIKKLTVTASAKQPILLQFDNFKSLDYLCLNNIFCNLDLKSLINCAHLSHILIGSIKNLKVNDVKDLIRSKKHIIRCLHLYGGKSIDDECLILLSEGRYLNELIIFRCESLTDHGLVSLASLKNLRILELCYNEYFTEKVLLSTLSSQHLRQLRRLKLFLIENVSPEILVLISEHYKCLQYFNVLRCPRLHSEFKTGWGLYEEHIETLRKKLKWFYI